MTAQQNRPVDGHSGLDRRTFLKAGVGSAAFLTVQSAFALDAAAQGDGLNPGLQFFNPYQAPTVEAIVERLWPDTEDSPGAREAGVLFYIDRALAGPYGQFQLAYRDGLEALDRASRDEYGASFVDLSTDQQDEVLTGISEGELERQVQFEAQEGLEQPPAAAEERELQIAGITPETASSNLEDFFVLIRTHTMEGLFADPIYGGNRDFAGWRAVGYPGAHYVYTEEEQQSFEPLDKPFQSIADL